MDTYVKPVDTYLPTSQTWVERYTGWFVPFSTPRSCGHRHETEERAQRCAQTLLNKARKDSR